LITLIFAGRNRMVMIGRELPRTKCAGSVQRPFRIELEEDSPFRGPFTVIGAAVLYNIDVKNVLGGGREFVLFLSLSSDGPDEA
jgi:hypothetical protein